MTGTRPVDWRVVAQREIAVKLTDKVFLGSTAFMLVATVLAIGLSTFFSGRVERPEVAVVGADAVALVEAADDIAAAADRSLSPQAVEVDDAAAAERLVADDEAAAALLPAEDGWEVVGTNDVDGTLQRYLGEAVAADALERNAGEAGVQVSDLQAGAELGVRLLDPGALPEELRYITGFAFAFLFYVTALTFGMAIAQSVVEEKQSRVVEILAAAIPVRQLLMGKVVGNALLAIAQVLLLVGVGLVGLALTGQADALAPVLSAGGWFVVFFLLGFAAIACVWAVAGSVATRSEDLQATTTPVTVVVMAALFGGLLAQGKALTVLSFVPLVSSVAMPIRMLEGGVPLWQPIASGVVVLVSAVVLVTVGARLYEGSLLQTQRRTTLKEAFSR
jgi:ABC-2 type transport system permease protein